MKGIVGEKLTFINTIDKALADDIEPTYTIELAFVKSPQKKVKVGAIIIFKAQDIEFPMPDKIDEKARWEAHQAMNKQTEAMWQDPIYFKEPEGRWISWALDEVLRWYDKLGGNAKVVLKAPQLKIRQIVSSKSIAAGRSDLRALFKPAWDIDKLLDKDFAFDPWNNHIRRGTINAAMGKR